MEGKGKPRANVAAPLPVQGPAMLPHDDLWLQLQAVKPWDRHNYGLRPGTGRRAQEGPEHRRGKQLLQCALASGSMKLMAAMR